MTRGARHHPLNAILAALLANGLEGAGDATYCPGCGKTVIERDWYEILRYDLDDTGRCKHCQTAIAGRVGKFGKPFGSRRIPVRFHVASQPMP